MAVLGFTTVSSLLKEQSEMVKAKGIEAYGVSVLDDSDGKHEPIRTSNAQLHLFMQIKRGNVTHMLFQSAEQVEIFFSNMEAYYGKEKADGFLKPLRFISVADSKDALSSRGLDSIDAEDMPAALSQLSME